MSNKQDLEGVSKENSVTFFSNEMAEGATASIDKEGKIKVEKIKRYKQSDSTSYLNQCLILFLLFREISYHLDSPIIFYHIPTIICVLFFVNVILEKRKNKENRKFHGAEHKVVNWFNDRNRWYKSKGIEEYSRIDRYCGTNLLATIVTFQIVSSVVMWLYNIHIPDVLTIVLPFYVYCIFPFNILGIISQLFFTTAKPEKKHIYVAEQAFKAAYKDEIGSE